MRLVNGFQILIMNNRDGLFQSLGTYHGAQYMKLPESDGEKEVCGVIRRKPWMNL